MPEQRKAAAKQA
jgi:hypothetical protein